MGWSKEKPTTTGYYWWRMVAGAPKAFVVEVLASQRKGDARLEACFTTGEVSYLEFMNHGEWFGPLEEP
jgi:hypothetical protein